MAPPPFQAFLDDHREPVYRFLVATVGRQEADDCFQETFIAALRAYPALREASNLRAWVLTIAYRKAIDALRSNGRRAVAVREVPDRADPADSPVEARDPALWARVGALPAKQRGAVALRFIGDFSYNDIADALGCSVPAARRSVHEGLAKLREEHPS